MLLKHSISGYDALFRKDSEAMKYHMKKGQRGNGISHEERTTRQCKFSFEIKAFHCQVMRGCEGLQKTVVKEL